SLHAVSVIATVHGDRQTLDDLRALASDDQATVAVVVDGSVREISAILARFTILADEHAEILGRTVRHDGNQPTAICPEQILHVQPVPTIFTSLALFSLRRRVLFKVRSNL